MLTSYFPKWFQDLLAGRLRTPRSVYQAAMSEAPLPDERFFGVPPDGIQWDAPKRLRVPDSFFTSEPALRQYERADFAHTDPRLIYWAFRFVEAARKRGIPLYVHTALRDKAEQNRLRAAGRSRASYPASAHNIGEAVDIVHGLFHWDMSQAEWQLLHQLGLRVLDRVNAQLPNNRKLHLTWGGDFKSLYDPAHWEITDFRARRRELPPVDPVRYTPRAYLRSHGVS